MAGWSLSEIMLGNTRAVPNFPTNFPSFPPKNAQQRIDKTRDGLVRHRLSPYLLALNLRRRFHGRLVRHL